LKVLVSAYACEPGKGSEPGSGWNWVRQIARFEECWVITRANQREAIERALAFQPMPTARFIYYDLPRWARFWKKGQRGVRAYYFLWQIGAYRIGRRLHRQIRFDLVHHVTFATYWLPSFLALMPLPFLWGPVGGGESAPRSFGRSFSLRGKAYEFLRDLARRIGELDPFVRMTAQRAAVSLATTPETAERLQALGCRKILLSSQAALTPEERLHLGRIPIRNENPFRVLSIGRLLHWKGFEFGLNAFAAFHEQFPASEYWLIGEGPEKKRLEELTEKLRLKDCVVFWGSMARQEVLEKIADCNILMHPSLHDSSGWAIVEAMAAGRPVVCLGLGGPARQVNVDCGIQVPAGDPEQVVRDLAAALKILAQDRTGLASMAANSREQVREHFDWDRRGEFLIEIYRFLVKKSSVTRQSKKGEIPVAAEINPLATTARPGRNTHLPLQESRTSPDSQKSE
jgi:glycosyltransferase involved in cell wall biosynthesis